MCTEHMWFSFYLFIFLFCFCVYGIHIYTCVCMCIDVYVYVCIFVCMCEHKVNIWNHPYWVRDSQSNQDFTGTVILQASLHGLCLYLPRLELQLKHQIPQHFMVSRDLNSGPQACMASTLTTEPSPSPCNAKFGFYIWEKPWTCVSESSLFCFT